MATVAETQLQLYNDALQMCEERPLATLTEARKPRYELDRVWLAGGVNDCLEESDWDFGRRTIEATYDPSIQPDFGYLHAFKKPDDWLRTSGVSDDPYFENALTRYQDEAGYWWSDLQTIYIKYISSDPAYGGDFTKWTGAFKQFAASHFASKVVGVLTHDKSVIQKVMALRENLLSSARSKDAMNDPPGFFPRGQWSRARRGMFFGRPDRTGRY